MKSSWAYIVAICVGWLGAHLIKYGIDRRLNRHLPFKQQLFTSGGMPSAHAATCTSLLTVVGAEDGITSGVFGAVLLLTIIVCYDATHVRRLAGETATLVSSTTKMPLKITRGHLPFEVLVGSIIGCIIGIVVFLAIK